MPHRYISTVFNVVLFETSSSSSDNSTYPDTYTTWENFKEEKLSPFGYLRLHNYADIN